MVINLRGTSGSGKSTIVRNLMEKYAVRWPIRVEGRKQPIGYWMLRKEGEELATAYRPLWVVGHYETACGGGDTISAGIESVYSQVRAAHYDSKADVIYEGLIVQSDVVLCIELAQRNPGQVVVIALNTSFEECLKSIEERRAARGDTRPLNPKNTIKKGEEVLRQKARFRDAGVDFRHLNREEAMRDVLQLMGWS